MRLTARSALLAAAACWAAFVVVLVGAYVVGPLEHLDARVLHKFMNQRASLPDGLVHLVAHSVNPIPLLLAVAALFGVGWALGRRRQAVAAVALVGGAYLTAEILKLVLSHPRFDPILGANQVGAAAFPSGHTTASTSLAFGAVLVAPPRARLPVALAAIAYVAAVTGSILVLGWHFPSDVMGGLLVASSFFFVAVAVLRLTADRSRQVAGPRALPPLRRVVLDRATSRGQPFAPVRER